MGRHAGKCAAGIFGGREVTGCWGLL
jgi:hypothetical protein